MQTVEEIQLQGGSGRFVAADLADAASIARLAKEVGDIDDRSPHDETRFARPFAFAPLVQMERYRGPLRDVGECIDAAAFEGPSTRFA